MKQLQCNFTTPEQSKRLLELGVPADSADCYYAYYSLDFSNDELIPKLRYDSYSKKCCFFNDHTSFIPCWSVGRLIELYMKAKGLDFMYFRIMSDSDMIDSIIRMFVENQNEFDFSKLEEV